MDVSNATDEQFKNYLYMLSPRGTAFWELYYSDSIMTEGKYEVTGEFLQWAEESYRMLKNSKMFGGNPNTGTTLSGNGKGENYAYGFSGFDGTDGIISLRNPATTPKEITFTFDRTMGVAENAGKLKYHLEHSYNLTEGTDTIGTLEYGKTYKVAGKLKYHLEHSYNLTEGTDTTGTLEYGKTYKITLQPDEVRILRVSKDGDTTAPKYTRAYTDGDKTITVKFNEKVNGKLFEVEGDEVRILRVSKDGDTTAPKYTRAYTDGDKTITVKFNEKVNGKLFEVEGSKIASINKSADGITYTIKLTESLEDGNTVTIKAKDIKDLAGNKLEDKTITTTYHKDNKVIESDAIDVSEGKKISDAEKSLNSNNGFTVSATVKTESKGSAVSQENGYDLGINKDGKAYFTLNGATAISEAAINDNVEHVITGVKENNGILKLYVDGELAGSAYNKENRYFKVNAGATTIGSKDFIGKVGVTVYDTAYGYDVVRELSNPSNERKPLDTTGMTVSVPNTSEGNKDKIFDNDPTTFWTSAEVSDGITKGNPYLEIDLNGSYIIDRVDYTKRFYNASENIWKCTGNLRDYVLEISNDGGKTWSEVKSGETFKDESFTEKGNGGTTEITFDPVEATNIRISGTESYHWQAENVNKFMTVGDIKVFGEKEVSTNLALNKEVIGKWTKTNENVNVNGDKPLSNAVNGNKTLNDYADFGKDDSKDSSYIQVDLGKVSDVESINLYRYWNGGRRYNGTVIALSETEAFDNPVIVYNSDAENVHGLGVGTDSTYAETEAGKAIKLKEVTKARYVRVYIHGSSAGDTNHIIELEVMGKQNRDPDELKTAIKEAKDVVAIKTTSSAKELISKVEEAEALLINGTTESIKTIIEELNVAKSSDKLVDRGNTEELADLIESYEALKESDYTKESWDSYKAKLDEAVAIVKDNSNSSQADVDAAKTALESAKNALVEAPVVTEVNKDELKKAIEKAEKVDENAYTNTSYDVMKAAYNRAIEFMNSNTVTQDQVNEATKSLIRRFIKCT